jgi:hypothetical protein
MSALPRESGHSAAQRGIRYVPEADQAFRVLLRSKNRLSKLSTVRTTWA